jgi:hypothetical protein
MSTPHLLHVVYGVPLTKEILHEMNRMVLYGEELKEIGYIPLLLEEFPGVKLFYNKTNKLPYKGYIGVLLCSYSTTEELNLDAVLSNWKATPEQKKQVLEALSLYPQVIKELSPVVGHYLVWE